MEDLKKRFNEIVAPDSVDTFIQNGINKGLKYKFKKRFKMGLCVGSAIIIMGLFGVCYAVPQIADNLLKVMPFSSVQDPDQSEAIKINKEIRASFVDKFGDRYPDDYGGAYIDDDGVLNINAVGGKVKSIEEMGKNYKIKYHNVKYSLNYLTEIVDTLSSKMNKLEIFSVSLDEIENKVIVCLDNLTPEKIEKISKLINNSSAVEYKPQGDITVKFDDDITKDLK